MILLFLGLLEAKVACSQHCLKGHDGVVELSEVVIEACEELNNFKFLYDMDTPLIKG
jgi:formate--tetrahydrofolate ligase